MSKFKGMSSTFPKVRKMCFPNFRKIFSENFPNFRKIFSFFPKVRKNIFRKFGKIKFRCSHLLSIVVRFLSQSTVHKTYFFQCHSQFESYENQNGFDASTYLSKHVFWRVKQSKHVSSIIFKGIQKLIQMDSKCDSKSD